MEKGNVKLGPYSRLIQTYRAGREADVVDKEFSKLIKGADVVICHGSRS